MYRNTIRKMSHVVLAHPPPIPVFGIEGRYVSALYSAAAKNQELDGAEKSLRALYAALDKPTVKDFIESSMMTGAAKAKLMQEVAKEAGYPATCTNFLAVVAENGRLKMLRKMIRMFLAVMVAHRNEAHCEVIVAEPLDSNTRNKLMEILKKFVKDKKITLNEKVDGSVIGGMIVGIEDKHIDLCIAKKINTYSAILKELF